MARVNTIGTVRGPSSGTDSYMFGTGGSPGFDPARFPGYVNTSICVMDNGSTYIKLLNGYASNTEGEISYINRPWSMKIWAGPYDFLVKCDQGSTRDQAYVTGSNANVIYGPSNTVEIEGSSGSANGYWSYTNPNQTVPVIGQECDPLSYGYIQVPNIANWDKNADSTELYYYMAGYIDTNSNLTLQNAITMDAVKLAISSSYNPEFFEYFPWQRRLGGVWMSLNRNGLNSTTGLYRMVNGIYRPCTNMHGNASKSHGFIYNNGWQISDKSGQGA